MDALDYATLRRRAQTFTADERLKPVRLALLADCATQHIVPLLRVLAADRGFNLSVYEAPYEGIGAEVSDPESGLYKFAPDFVSILNMTEKAKRRLGPDQPERGWSNEASRIVSIWDAIANKHACKIIQSTMVMPAEREFGNYESLMTGSLGYAVSSVNRHVAEAARERKDVFVNDVEYLAGEVGRMRWRDEKLWLMAKIPCALDYLPRLAKNIVDIIAASMGSIVKCVVLDLDNTLWGGVIGDDGLDGIALGDLGEGQAYCDLQHHLLNLKKRGIILAVNSKNEHANAILPFREHPDMVLKEDDIAVFRANWNDKASNLHAIRDTLNIGFDSMVFLDDNPFERNLVRGLIPQVIVPELPEDPGKYLATIAELNLFETTTHSREDAERADLYRQEAKRQEMQSAFGSYEEYLRSLEMTGTISRFTPFNLPRIAQLIQRSNQFNLTTRRYGESECAALMEDEANCYPFTVTLADNVGSHGLISVIALKFEGEVARVDLYLMSCRVLRRGVEDFAMNHIVEVCSSRGIRTIVGEYIPSSKNAMVERFYEQFGFTPRPVPDTNTTEWVIDVADYTKRPHFITAAQA
ncbi:HAD-IIIC family phosphatase [Trinickia violacea]|nr:HAD-IIIC family phosphatase [Trinickia violacea]